MLFAKIFTPTLFEHRKDDKAPASFKCFSHSRRYEFLW